MTNDSHNPEVLAKNIELLLTKNRRTDIFEAEALTKEAMHLSQNNPTLVRQRAQVEFVLEHYDAAEELAARALELHNEVPLANQLLARIRIRQISRIWGRSRKKRLYNEAYEFFNAEKDVNPDYHIPHAELTWDLILADCRSLAEEELLLTKKAVAEEQAGTEQLIDALITVGRRNINEAADLVRVSLNEDPSNATANRQLAHIEMNLGHKEEALSLAGRALHFGPEVPLVNVTTGLIELNCLRRSMRKTEKTSAIQKIQDLLRKEREFNPTFHYPEYRVSSRLAGLGFARQALGLCTHALEQNPLQPRIIFALAFVLLAMWPVSLMMLVLLFVTIPVAAFFGFAGMVMTLVILVYAALLYLFGILMFVSDPISRSNVTSRQIARLLPSMVIFTLIIVLICFVPSLIRH